MEKHRNEKTFKNWLREGGGGGFRMGNTCMYTCGGVILVFGKTNTICKV